MEETGRKTYISPEAVLVVFKVSDIVITSTGGSEEGDDD